jgi:hypothetical protein
VVKENWPSFSARTVTRQGAGNNSPEALTALTLYARHFLGFISRLNVSKPVLPISGWPNQNVMRAIRFPWLPTNVMTATGS